MGKGRIYPWYFGVKANRKHIKYFFKWLARKEWKWCWYKIWWQKVQIKSNAENLDYSVILCFGLVYHYLHFCRFEDFHSYRESLVVIYLCYSTIKYNINCIFLSVVKWSISSLECVGFYLDYGAITMLNLYIFPKYLVTLHNLRPIATTDNFLVRIQKNTCPKTKKHF